MEDKWWLAGDRGAPALAAAGGAWQAGLPNGLGGPLGMVVARSVSVWVSADGEAGRGDKGDKGDKKPEVPLEFAPREVVQPALARLPGVVEFSGPRGRRLPFSPATKAASRPVQSAPASATARRAPAARR